MPIIRKLVAQDENCDNQWLKVDHASRYIENDSKDWQFLFGPNSELSNSIQILKIAAEFDGSSFDKIRMVGYLYNQNTGNVDAAGSVTFNIYRVADNTNPKWDDVLITTQSGLVQNNGYFFKDISISSLTGASLDGETTLMIEVVATRGGTTYRDRVYANSLGVFDSVLRNKKDIRFLAITKQDV